MIRKYFLSVCCMLIAVAGKAQTVSDYIAAEMPATVRQCRADTLGKLALPYPYSVPCIRDNFQDMYYWDTYFTNLGLLKLGQVEQARNNIDDILHLIGRVGYMPNGSNVALLNRSQPPYASMMVSDVFDATDDTVWLAHADSLLRREYDFWMTQRMAPCGLNRYGHNATDDELEAFFYGIYPRLGRNPADVPDRSERLATGAHLLAEAESGWDFNPRFDGRCLDFAPVDLNSNLYIYEQNFARNARILGKPDADEWLARAARRNELMDKYMLASDSLYYDYDFVGNRKSAVYSAASFWPLYAGVADSKVARAAVEKGLPLIEQPHGVAACRDTHQPVIYQWDYPNCWGALNVVVVLGLKRYGYDAHAAHVAKKYTDATERIYNCTGNLWEKYNAASGDIDVKNEYALPGAFMGWTAGAYLVLYSLVP